MSGRVFENAAGLVFSDADGLVHDDACPQPSCCVPCTQVYTAHVCGFSPDCNQVFICKGVYDGTAGPPAVVKGTLSTWNGTSFGSPEFFACVTGIGDPVIDLVDLQPGAFVMRVIDGAADCEDVECTGEDPTDRYVLARPCGGTGPIHIAVLASEITSRVFFSVSGFCYCIDCTANEYVDEEDLPVDTSIMTFAAVEALAFDGDCCSCICGVQYVEWPNLTICQVEEITDGMTIEESEAERLSRRLTCCCPDPYYAGSSRLRVSDWTGTIEYWSYAGTEGETLTQYVKGVERRTSTTEANYPQCVEGESPTGTSTTTDVVATTSFTRYIDDFGVWHEINSSDGYTSKTSSDTNCGEGPCVPESIEPAPGSTVPCENINTDEQKTTRVVTRTSTCDADVTEWTYTIETYTLFGSTWRLASRYVQTGIDAEYITAQRGKGRCVQATSCVAPLIPPGELMADAGGPEEFQV